MIVILSAFIPYEGLIRIKESSKEEAKNLIKNLSKTTNIKVFSNHQTVKVLGLEPAKDRTVYEPNPKDIQIWIKPNGRLEFGRGYSLEEIEEIGYRIYVALNANIYEEEDLEKLIKEEEENA